MDSEFFNHIAQKYIIDVLYHFLPISENKQRIFSKSELTPKHTHTQP